MHHDPPSKNGLASIFLARFARYFIESCTYLASLTLKMKYFLQNIKNPASIRYLQVKIQGNLLARFWSNLARQLSYIFSCKKSLVFSVSLARYVQDLVQYLASLARKTLVYFFSDSFYWEVAIGLRM